MVRRQVSLHSTLATRQSNSENPVVMNSTDTSTPLGFGFPVPSSTDSYWRSDLSWLDDLQSTKDLPSSCDILIIGAGLSGVATAYHILKAHATSFNPSATPPPSIVLLEARQICSGATGRNGGHSKTQPANLATQVADVGIERIEEYHAFVRANQYALKATIEEEGIECESELRRSWDVCLDEGDAEVVMWGYEGLKAKGMRTLQDIEVVGEKYVERITSMKGAKAALSTPVFSFWPYKFVTQLLERCLHLGAEVHAHTPVTSLSTTTTIPTQSNISSTTTTTTTAHTPRGNIRAKKVIFATNGYTPALLPQYTTTITPTKSTACHIAIPDGKTAPQLTSTYNIRFEPGRTDYMNPRPDGGIVIGGAQWTYQKDMKKWWNVVDDSTVIPEAKGHFEGVMQRHFAGWEGSGAVVDSMWTGIQGVTADHWPHIGRVPGTENQYILAAFNGGGMAMIFVCAKGIARMVMEGVDFAETGIPKMFETGAARLSGKTGLGA